jgi:MFS family permease
MTEAVVIGEDVRHPLGRIVPALHHRNFRLFSLGQALSIIGTWMQDVAQAWYVLQESNSAAVLGAVMAAEYVPILLLSPYGGALADRYDKRKLIAYAQVFLGVVAILLGVVVSLDGALWMIFGLAVLRGLGGCIDLPARSSFMTQLVLQEHLRSASAFGSLVWNTGRALGPVAAAICIGGVGIAWCFYINAITYVLLLVLVLGIRKQELWPLPRTRKARVRDGWRHVVQNADVRAILLALLFIGTFAYNTATIFPLMAQFLFSGEVGVAAQLITAAGIGAMISGLVMARRGTPTRTQVLITTLAFACAISATALSTSVVLATVCTFLWGVTNAAFAATVNSFIQLRCAPEFRGRIMAFWTALVYGSTAVGAPIIGLVAEIWSVRVSLGMIAASTFVAALAVDRTFKRHPEAV